MQIKFGPLDDVYITLVTALQQFIDNSDPDECGDLPDEMIKQRNIAIELVEQIEDANAIETLTKLNAFPEESQLSRNNRK